MKVALIADIHGNLVALNAALAAIGRLDVDHIICLGDVAAVGPQPVEVINLLAELSLPVVMGNTDDWLLEPVSWDVDSDERRLSRDVMLWNAEQLGAAERDLIRDYAPRLSYTFDEGVTLLCYHGSPRNYDDIIRPTTPEEALAEMFEDYEAQVMAGGHTHVPMVRQYFDSFLVNPGSVGLPQVSRRDGQRLNPTWAEYALLEWQQSQLTVSLRRARYPLATLAAAVRASGMPHADYWLSDWREPQLI